jgi:hypothetical protein
MRTILSAALCGCLLLFASDPVAARAGEGARALPKLDAPADLYAVPFFLVDTEAPGGTTTLYAVRNITGASVDLEVEYFTQGGALQRTDPVTLEAGVTLTVNVRDVTGLAVDPDGFARGWIRIAVVRAPAVDNLTGDFFQVDVDGNFATGDRLIGVSDLCTRQEIRALDFGAGTALRVFVNEPQGGDPESDPPSFTVTALDETGAAFAPREIFTDQVVLEMDASDLTDQAFGTLILEFTAGGGSVYAEYSAGGRFSVGLNAACVLP